MPRRPPSPQRRSPFDAFFDEIIDGVLERVEDVITPALENISQRVAESVEQQVAQGPPQPKRRRGVLVCTLCGQRPRDCRCRRARSGASTHPPPPRTPPDAPKRRETTLYDELEVTRNAAPETIRAAYLSLCKRFHPDIDPAHADRMKRITAAYDVLGDSEKRKQYDRTHD